MFTKRRNIITLITVLSVCIGIYILTGSGWPRAVRDKTASPDKDVKTAHDNIQTMPANRETNAKLLSSDISREMFTEPNRSATAKDKGGEILKFETPSPVVRHDMSAVRIALEKSNRPDLEGKPSGPERIRAHHKTLQIPDEELKKLSTEELVDKVSSSPLFVMMIAFPYADGGLSRYAESYNGVKEFLERPDAAKALLQTYRTLSKQVSEVERDSMYTLRFPIMEVLMSSEQVMNQLNDDGQRKGLIAAIIKSLDARAQYDISQPELVYGESTLEYSALAIARYLDLLGDPQYKNWYVQKRETGLFVKRAANYAESKEIVSMARKYLGSLQEK